MLALTRHTLKEYGHGGCSGGVQACLILGLEPPMFQGRAVPSAADAHDGPQRVADNLLPLVPAIWAVLAEGGYRGQHEARI